MASAIPFLTPAWSTRIEAKEPGVPALNVEYLKNPVGLDVMQPRFGWWLDGKASQGAYQVRVASTAAKLRAGDADLWDSGKVKSSQSVDVAYAGKPLHSRQICHWTVDLWDDRDRPLASPGTGGWEMGLLEKDDWSANWIAAETTEQRLDREAGMPWLGSEKNNAKFFRFDFSVDAPATLELIADSTRKDVDIWIDGERQALRSWDANAMGPPPARQVATDLESGQHVVAIRIAGMPAWMTPSLAMAAFLKLTYRDGTVKRIATTQDWRVAASAPSGWEQPGFDADIWDAAVARPELDRLAWPAQRASLIRKGFDIAKSVRKARLYISALGSFVAYLNGERVSDELLTPGVSDFRKRCWYRTYDVSDMFAKGANILGLHVGEGWYGSYFPLVGNYAFGFPPCRVMAQLEVEYVDGSTATIGTDADCRLAQSPILESQLFEGEIYDAREEIPGWATPKFDASGWAAVHMADPPEGTLDSDWGPPIRVVRTLKPVSDAKPAPDVRLLDFGQNFAGLPKLRINVPRGTRIEMRFAERLDEMGRIDQSNLRSALARDVYIARGGGAEVYVPQFTYHGFRYVELVGPEEVLSNAEMEGLVIQSDMPVTAAFRSGSDMLDQLWKNTLWSQRSNFVSIPTDCPQRDERLGWTGDAAVFWDAAAFNMDVDAFTRRYMTLVRDGQTKAGAFPDIAPAAKPIQPSGPTATPGWADGAITLPWTIWQRYGDTAVIEQNFTAMRRYLDYLWRENPDAVWRKRRGMDFGDWLALDAKNPGDETTPKDLIGTAYWAHSTKRLAEMAAAIGSDATEELLQKHAKITAAFQQEFVRPDGSVGNDSQTGYILPLRFGLIPDELRKASGDRLAANIVDRGTLLTTGFLGTPYALDALADLGHVDLAYELLLRTEFPSWGYMVKRGATTIWERWNSDTGDVAMNSFNHYALGAVCGFVMRRIAGIDAAAPGFEHIRIAPLIHRSLGNVSAHYDSVRGRIGVEWEVASSGRYRLDVEVPANSVADLVFPSEAGRTLPPGRHRFRGEL